MANTTLTNAREAKQDEYYTQYYDIEREVEAYLDYNPDVFRGKTVLFLTSPAGYPMGGQPDE